MQTVAKQNSTLGLKVLVPGVPTTCEDYNTLASRPGNPCLDDAVLSVIYRSWNAEFRSAFVPAVAEALKADAEDPSVYDRQKVKEGAPKKDAEGNEVAGDPIMEQDGAYLARIIAASGKEVTAFQSIADEIAAGISFDPSPSQRQGQLPKKFREAAEDLFSKKTDEQLVAIASKLEEINPGLKVQIDGSKPNLDSFGRALRANAERAERESMLTLG